MHHNDIKITVPSSLENLALIRGIVRVFLELHSVSKKDIVQLLTVVDELSTNVVEHAYAYTVGDIILEIRKDMDNIKIIIEDNGSGFDENNISKDEGGMGLSIARAISDDFKIEKKINGTLFKVSKKIKEDL